jgi:hypothetical protein
VRLGDDASFSVGATGDGTLTYQWKKGGVPLTDDGRVMGSQTALLAIHDVTAGDAGDYRCVVTATCGAAESDAAALAVSTVAADLDGDGDVDGTDFGVFSGCFNGTANPVGAGCNPADLNVDGSVDGADYGILSGCFNGSGNPPACR